MGNDEKKNVHLSEEAADLEGKKRKPSGRGKIKKFQRGMIIWTISHGQISRNDQKKSGKGPQNVSLGTSIHIAGEKKKKGRGEKEDSPSR